MCIARMQIFNVNWVEVQCYVKSQLGKTDFTWNFKILAMLQGGTVFLISLVEKIRIIQQELRLTDNDNDTKSIITFTQI